ncbi:DUF3325 domain-containing protein [Stutzerimonas kirkiae]|uniref:DUF3325 domain-containing protein n=1 Tax=Stutzerimonas kirkiae TaxID=2211392 RepID=UPI0010384D92|nr:DUF3325 domain-containing protein [Stutzerimonas kirkiae]TBV08730.1 DUF3325 domain-containing protein [Stutzerimonas kirkiae]TBV11486.1 DUF3325 domain-containing protein [Stutzerimonas kirkiae]
MSAAFFEGVLLAYVGMLALCLGLERHYKQVWQQAPAVWLRRTLRATGWVALAGSFAICVLHWGWAMGPVGWFGAISMAALALVLLLPYGPRLSVALAALGWPLLAVVSLL